MDAKYKRILVKISGEALAGGAGRGLDFDFLAKLCVSVRRCLDSGIQVALVCGGGNYWRGAKDGAAHMVRSRADYMGMLATTMNCLALLDALEKQGVPAVIQSALGTDKFADPINRERAVAALTEGRVVLFAGGTGEPYFTTDTGAVLRALEIGADALLLGKNVDAIYSADPKKDPNAIRYTRLSYAEVIEQQLQATDLAAIQLASENRLLLHAFALEDPENIVRASCGEDIGTVIC